MITALSWADPIPYSSGVSRGVLERQLDTVRVALGDVTGMISLRLTLSVCGTEKVEVIGQQGT